MVTRPSEPPSTRTVIRIVVTVAATLLLLFAAYKVRNILTLALVALFLAIGLDPAVRKLQSLGMRRGLAMTTIFLGFLLLTTVFVLLLIPPLVRQIIDFATHLPTVVQDLADRNTRIQEWVQSNDIPAKLQQAVSDIPAVIGGSLASILGIAGSIATGIFSVVTVAILTAYFSAGLLGMHQGILTLVPKARRARVALLLDRVIEKIGSYIAGQVTVAAIAGVTAGVWLTIIRVPYSVALGMFVAFAALIPMVGATLGAIPACVIALFNSVPQAVAAIAFFVLYQQLENTLISPRVMTKAVDLSPAAVLLSALIGGSLLGFVGALMAIPTAASIKIVFQEVVFPLTERS
ncbi:AI-2E family transporter [soil metagenome]